MLSHICCMSNKGHHPRHLSPRSLSANEKTEAQRRTGCVPSLVFNGQQSWYGGATGLFASKPSFLWLYQSTSKQEGLAMTTQEKMVWQENSAVRFWALLTCQPLFWVKNPHWSFSVDPDLYSTMKTEGLLTISSPRALSWESSWLLLTSRGFSVLP